MADSKTFSIQINDPSKARHLAGSWDRIAHLTAGNRTALFESMASMLEEKVANGMTAWAAANQVTDEFARQFLTAVSDRHQRATSSAPKPTQNTTSSQVNQPKQTF